MSDARTCPDCGSSLPNRSPEGLCPRCLLGAGRASDGTGGVLDGLAETVGPLPSVLLRDTDSGFEPPLVRAASEADAGGPSRYRIDGEIARGGMGVVLRGRDPDLGREVAVKVLREEFRGDAAMVRRFVEEAQIGGQLQHPGIVPIYEMGTFGDRRPFFAMKLVKGRTLAGLLEARSGPSDGLPRLLAIFEAVAQTVAYAHARGVIHRDLKPSNVMVGSFGEVQVMDWGLAKVLPRGGVVDDAGAGRVAPEETVIATARSGGVGPDLSRAGSVLGTPSYMAPEQARGEIECVDERADVFALGSILCETLTGLPAFAGRASGEILRKAALGDLGEATTRLDNCGADAELVALTRDCLAREAADRPRSAGAVVGRASAYLAGVQERLRQAELDRVEERARRRITTVAAASVILLGLLGGGGLAWDQRQKAGRASRIARAVDEALADASRLRGEAQAAPPGDSARWALALAAAERAEGLLAQGEADDPLRGRVGALLAQLGRERDDAADRAARIAGNRALLSDLESIRAGRLDEDDPRKNDDAYSAAFVRAGLDLDRAGPEAVRAWLAGRPELVELAGYLDDWSLVRRTAGRGETARRRLVDAARAADSDPWRDALRALLAVEGGGAADELRRLADDRPALDAQPAASLILLARQLWVVAGDLDRAATVLRRGTFRHPGDYWARHELGVARAHSSKGQDPAGEEALLQRTAAVAIRPASPIAHINLGYRLASLGRRDEAIAEFREATRLGPGSAGAHDALASQLEARGDLDESAAEFHRAVRLDCDGIVGHFGLIRVLKKRGKADGVDAEFREAVRLRPDDLSARHSLALILKALGRREEAVAEYREAVRLRPDDPKEHEALASALGHAGRLNEAIAEHREAIRLAPDRSEYHILLGNTLDQVGRHDEAIAEFREAITLTPDNPLAHYYRGLALASLGSLDEAIAQQRAAIRLWPELSWSHSNLARNLKAQGKLDEAAAEFRESLRLSFADTVSLADLRKILRDRGEFDEETALLRDRVERARKDRGAGDPGNAAPLAQLGANLIERRLWAEAEPVLRDCLAIREKAEPDAWTTFNTRVKLGEVLSQQGRYPEAEPLIVSGYEGLKARLGRPPSGSGQRTAEAAERIVPFYEAWGKPDRAAEWRARVENRSPAEWLGVADLARSRKQYAAMARCMALAIEADPKLAESRELQPRYNAACAGALAASGQGKDDPPLDAAARVRLRVQAIAWLEAERDAWTKFLDSGPPGPGSTILRDLIHWREDADLAGIRDPDALAGLPDLERERCRKLWADVDALVRRAQAKVP